VKRLLFLILLTACSLQISTVTINDVDIPVELATTDDERARGLMFRENLEGGMLFIYNSENLRRFWMKNTLIPLDIIFIDADNIVTIVHRATPCEEDPCEIYPGNAKYILEVNQNYIDVNVGDSVSFSN